MSTQLTEMSSLRRFLAGLVLLLTLGILSSSQLAYAQSDSLQPNSITVSPATAEVFVSDEDPEKVFMITVQNGYKEAVNLVAELRGIDDANGRIIPTGTPSAAISRHLVVDQAEFSVEPSGKHFIKIFAKNSSSLPAGGHYASLVIHSIDNANQQSSLNSEISVGVFLVKSSGASKDIQLVGNRLTNTRFGIPKELDLEFFNNGNVHLVPRASIQVFAGQTSIYHDVINQRSKQILPGKRYAEKTSLNPITDTFWPQKLTVVVEYRADGIDSSKSWQSSTWVIPPLFIGTTAVGLALFATATFYMYRNRRSITRKLRALATKFQHLNK